jgi:hypothetical protein
MNVVRGVIGEAMGRRFIQSLHIDVEIPAITIPGIGDLLPVGGKGRTHFNAGISGEREQTGRWGGVKRR